MGPSTLSVLQKLSACPEGKGMPLSAGEARVASRAINEGLCWSLGFGSVKIFMITDKGREAVKAAA